jgi:hypothetical protein
MTRHAVLLIQRFATHSLRRAVETAIRGKDPQHGQERYRKARSDSSD